MKNLFLAVFTSFFFANIGLSNASDPLDGSVILITSEDPVKETLVFENGLITSTFENPVDNEHNVQSGISYTLDEGSDGTYKITLPDGDFYTFDPTTGTGSLTDYSNGQIDESGSWNFSFERFDWEDYDDFSGGSLESNKWEVTWFKGGRAPAVVNGALQLSGSGDPNDPASDSIPYQFTLLDVPEGASIDDMSTHPHALITDSSVYGLEAEIMIPSGSQNSTGLNFMCFDTTTGGWDGSFKQFGPEIAIWSDQGPTLEYEYLDAITGEKVDVSIPADFDLYYKASLIQDGSKSYIFIEGEKVAEFDFPEFSPNAYGFFAFNDDGHSFETYVKNVRVLRRSQMPADNAPSALTGLRVSIDDVQTNPSIDFPEVKKYFSDQFIYGYENSEWQEYPYIYTKISGFDAELTILYEDGNKTYYLTFSDDQNASGNWSKNSTDENTSGSTQFTIITDDLAPETLSTWYYETDPLSDWIYFKSSVSANFFYDYFPETNSSFVENITYKWEKLGPSIGRITMDTDEETWLFFSNLTYGYYDLSSKDGSFESSGTFQLSKFDDGLSVDGLAGDKITIGEKHYIFHEGNEVSTLNQDGSSTLTTYAYIRTDQNEAILSVADGLLIDMKFLDYDYGRITNGGSGYFEYHSSYATKGWLWYDDLPWIFSSNQGDWIYQNVFINDSNETELMYQFKTSGIITKSGELDYIGESNLSKMDAFYWDDYDNFSGSDLNSSKWDVAWWDGGASPTLDQDNDQVVFNKGVTYEGRLSGNMTSVNPQAESKYGRGLGTNTDYAPNSIAGLQIVVHEKENLLNGEIDDYGEEEYLFSDSNLTRFDWDENKYVVEKYDYQKTGPNTAVIQIFELNSTSSYKAELTFISPSSATGSWNEKEDDQEYIGTLDYELIYEPHSLLEIIDSQNVYGVEYEVMVPQSSPDEVCIGLFAMDYNKMFNATSEDEELGATKFELDLCLFSTLNLEFYYYDPITYEEIKADPISVPLGEFQRVGFKIQGDEIIFFHEDNIISQYPYQKGNETYVFRAMNEQNLDFSAYIKNVKVLRKKAFPKGWMWMDYYPWAYSAETGNWLYFKLAKDVDGLPGMIFWDESTNTWDLYQP